MQRLALAAMAALPMVAAGALAVPADPVQPTGGVEVGEVVDFTFRHAVSGSMGESSLADFRGKPVLIDFWGTR